MKLIIKKLKKDLYFIKIYFVKLFNNFYKTESILESKKKWKHLASKNANYYVLTTFGESLTEEQFLQSGKEDYEKFIKNDALVKEIGPLNSLKVLEIGCGTGRVTEFMAQDFNEVYGIDISEGMIDQAKIRLKEKNNIQLIPTDGIHMPFSDNFFDFVFSFIVFQHMPSKKIIRKNLEEVARVLVSDGLAKIQVRGIPVAKRNWFYGPSFTVDQVQDIVHGLPLNIIKIEGVGSRYLWVWLKKS